MAKKNRWKASKPTNVIDKAGDLALKGVERPDIARACEVSNKTVDRYLASFVVGNSRLKQFKEIRADIFAQVQLFLLPKLLEGIRDVPIETSNDIRNIATTWAILYDKERLERGKATEITSITRLDCDLEFMIKEHERFMRQGSPDILKKATFVDVPPPSSGIDQEPTD